MNDKKVKKTNDEIINQPIKNKFKLVGHKNFVRCNPKSDLFTSYHFDHVEFYCQDATNVSRRFSWGLGMNLIGKSDHSTGNQVYASYILQSNKLKFIFSAPYSIKNVKNLSEKERIKSLHYPAFDMKFAHEFNNKHGLAVRALGIHVADARKAYEIATTNGAISVTPTIEIKDIKSNEALILSEVQLYGDVVLRFISGEYADNSISLPNYERIQKESNTPDLNIGIQCLDHAVGNVSNLLETVDYITSFTGFHEFAEFTSEDVGTVDSGLNSMVLANNSETILLPINEPTFGTKRKSQIQTYLEQNEGPGLQHLALKTNDIFLTMFELKKKSLLGGGFDFMPSPNSTYYKNLKKKIPELTDKQLLNIEKLGLLADKDDQGILLQIFTKPIGDRPTIFLEIIERIGCMTENINGRLEQAAGCGGFGKGNFSELFKSIETYEKQLKI